MQLWSAAHTFSLIGLRIKWRNHTLRKNQEHIHWHFIGNLTKLLICVTLYSDLSVFWLHFKIEDVLRMYLEHIVAK